MPIPIYLDDDGILNYLLSFSQNWISDKVEQDFQMDFVVDLKDGLSTNEGTWLVEEF